MRTFTRRLKGEVTDSPLMEREIHDVIKSQNSLLEVEDDGVERRNAKRLKATVVDDRTTSTLEKNIQASSKFQSDGWLFQCLPVMPRTRPGYPQERVDFIWYRWTTQLGLQKQLSSRNKRQPAGFFTKLDVISFKNGN